jgi:hypothetical protein
VDAKLEDARALPDERLDTARHFRRYLYPVPLWKYLICRVEQAADTVIGAPGSYR